MDLLDFPRVSGRPLDPRMRLLGNLSGFLLAVITLLSCSISSNGEDRTAENTPAVDFARDVAPLIQQHCIRCHRPENQKGEISLATSHDLFDQGHIVSGKPEASALLSLVTSQGGKRPAMPKDAEPLTATQVAVFREWISRGANWPKEIEIHEATRAGRDWWSLQPVVRPQLPTIPAGQGTIENADWTRNPIDRFILSQLIGKAINPSVTADRATFIRRLSFDLLGLPPSPEAVAAFVSDADPQAYEKLVDQMLASPHYGERWARHWLDIAHYADTHGFERDQRRDNAWRYRDWVIQALNRDLPYDVFIKEQIAGDVIRPRDRDAVIATGFLAAGPWDFVGQAETKSEVLKRAARADDLDDMITQVMTATCGVTVNCARCHDHKLDPITQRDYYSLWAVFAGAKRGDRDVSSQEVLDLEIRKQTLRTELHQIGIELAKRRGRHLDLADVVGGGDGKMPGVLGAGIDPLTGQPQSAKRGFAENAQVNRFVRSSMRFIDGVVIPNSSPDGTPISSTGLKVNNVPKTSGQVWDAIRFGPVNSHFSTKLGGLDFASADHTLLSLHANAAITFDLEAIRKAGAPSEMKLTATAGYFGETPKNGASFSVYVDGESKFQRDQIGRDDGLIPIEITIPMTARFLTLMATDGGNGIGHDQICFADAWLGPAQARTDEPDNQAEIERLQKRRADLDQQLKSVPMASRVYALLSEKPEPVKILKRGDPEQPDAEVVPAALAAVAGLNPILADSQAPDGERRLALAEWITSPANPLTRRVLVNRLWHYHFGTGLVDTPSDFGYGGGRPSHPELLDWMADEFLSRGWSMKSMHRLICTSQTYRQTSSLEAQTLPKVTLDGNLLDDGADAARAPHSAPQGRASDTNNRLLWRMNPRRLDAESLRDAVLSISGKLNPQMFGPGYRDFEYQEEYAPVYRYITPDTPSLWRRTVYRFVVRTTPHQFLTTLDCPSSANLTPSRNVTTTVLQSLALLNNDFMLRQSQYLANRVQADAGNDVTRQIERVFQLAFSRQPSPAEVAGATKLVNARGLTQLCRMILNANEFVYID